MPASIWQQCVSYLQDELPSQQFNTWIRPLKINTDVSSAIQLSAPNRYIKDWVSDKYMERINELVSELCTASPLEVKLEISNQPPTFRKRMATNTTTEIKPVGQVNQLRYSTQNSSPVKKTRKVEVEGGIHHDTKLFANYTFDTFVEGKSNQLARAAAMQVAENAGDAYNPLFLYGGVGLGKTHLMHAVGNALLERNPEAKVVYIPSERFVADMVKALQLNAINEFKRYYRTVDALLIDDIQLFAGKERSQEEFFHTFNALLEGGQQMILTCDRFPKEIAGLEERLKSRFGRGRAPGVRDPGSDTIKEG